jgi:hypothetical protein
LLSTTNVPHAGQYQAGGSSCTTNSSRRPNPSAQKQHRPRRVRLPNHHDCSNSRFPDFISPSHFGHFIRIRFLRCSNSSRFRVFEFRAFVIRCIFVDLFSNALIIVTTVRSDNLDIASHRAQSPPCTPDTHKLLVSPGKTQSGIDSPELAM